MKVQSEKIVNFFKKAQLLIKTNYGVCLISIFLASLFLVNRNLFIINPYAITIDPWVYTGYFLNFESYYQTFGVLYYGTRLSWIIPGYVLYTIFPTLTANYVLHFGFIAAAVLSVYFILRQTISDRVAIFTALLFAGYVYLLNEMGWDYISGAVITFFLLTVLFLTLSAQSRFWKYHLFLAGIFCISMIYTNFFTIIFLPTLIAFLLFIYLNQNKLPLIPRLFYLILGIFVGSATMELFAYWLTGKILVILGQVKTAAYYNNISNPWQIPIENWILSASWLLFPLIIVIGCIIFLLFNNWKNKYSYNLFFILNFLATVLIFIGLHIKGNPVFQVIYYACYLIPPMFLAMGAMCSGILDSLTSRHFYFILCSEICLLLLPYTSINSFLKSEILQLGMILFFLFFAACWIIFFFFSIFFQKIQISRISVFIILFAVISISLFNGILYSLPDPNNPDNYENGFVSVIDSVKIINGEANGQNVKFWYDSNESGKNGYYGGIFNNINAMYLWGYTFIGRDFPKIDKKNIDPLLKSPTTKIVILSTKDDAYLSANKTLSDLGYRASFLSEKMIKTGNINFNLTFIKIEQ